MLLEVVERPMRPTRILEDIFEVWKMRSWKRCVDASEVSWATFTSYRNTTRDGRHCYLINSRLSPPAV